MNDWSWLTPAALAAEPQRALRMLHQAAQDGDAHALANLGEAIPFAVLGLPGR